MKKITLLILMFFTINLVKSQDTIVTTDNTVLTGEIKSMDRGVLVMETDFSDDDFHIEWLKIKEVVSPRLFRVILTNQERLYGTISYVDGQIIVQDKEKGAINVKIEDLVYIKQVDEGNILDVLNLQLDVGYSFTNAKNLEQLNGSLKADYTTNRWGANIYASTVRSKQTDVDLVERNTGGFGIKMFAKYGFFANIGADYMSNTEQSMQLRSNYNISVGKYLFRTNRQYLTATGGAVYLIENYSDTLPDRLSTEGKFGVEYNMFDMGDLNLFTSVNLFPSFTEKGRMRTEFKFEVKLDLPRDFYIKGSLNYNYDNMPAPGVSFDDYVYTFGVGWEL